MALKDWKKTRGKDVWQKGNTVLGITYYENDNRPSSRRVWWITFYVNGLHVDNSKFGADKTFTEHTKTKVLKYAKDYMRLN